MRSRPRGLQRREVGARSSTRYFDPEIEWSDPPGFPARASRAARRWRRDSRSMEEMLAGFSISRRRCTAAATRSSLRAARAGGAGRAGSRSRGRSPGCSPCEEGRVVKVVGLRGPRRRSARRGPGVRTQTLARRRARPARPRPRRGTTASRMILPSRSVHRCCSGMSTFAPLSRPAAWKIVCESTRSPRSTTRRADGCSRRRSIEVLMTRCEAVVPAPGARARPHRPG